MRNQKAAIFNSILDTFENDDIRKLTELMIEDIPGYFYDIGASSTGKYHPKYALGDLGLTRHTVALVRIMNHIFALEHIQDRFDSRNRDLLRMSGIMHDSRKSGNDGSRFTVFDHPLLAAEAISRFKGVVESVTDDEIELAARACESHMGQWNTNKRNTTVLPKPQGKYEELLHLCDYLASRKDIEILFENFESVTKIEDYKFTFGKYKGQLLVDIAKANRGYLEWMSGNLKMQEPLKSFVQELLA